MPATPDDPPAPPGPTAAPTAAPGSAEPVGPLDPVEQLERIAFLLEAALEPAYRVKAFRGAARTLRAMASGEVERRSAQATLRELPGIGEVTARVVTEALAGEVPVYLRRLEATGGEPVEPAAQALREALRGDCHTHSDWSDGGSPILEMALAARDLGHDYVVLTDHSPRLTVANGLSPDRLREQLRVVAGLNEELAPFRILTGIEVDINADGTLDQEPDLLDQLDLVVASVHSLLKMPAAEMTARMVRAVSDPHTDVLGHCTGRNVTPRGRGGKLRPESAFDPELVFAAWPSRSTAAPSGWTRPSGCCAWPSRPGAGSPSTPTPTPRVSSPGSRPGATARCAAASRPAASSTPAPRRSSWPGPPAPADPPRRPPVPP